MHRHNVGFMAADVIADTHGFSAPAKKFQGWIQDGRIGRERVLLLKPATYMNESGRSVRAAMDFYKLAPQDVRSEGHTSELQSLMRISYAVFCLKKKKKKAKTQNRHTNNQIHTCSNYQNRQTSQHNKERR